MAQIDPVSAFRAHLRTVANCENHRLALFEQDDLGTRLHARALFGNDEFAAFEFFMRRAQEDGGLKRENVLAVKVLVETV